MTDIIKALEKIDDITYEKKNNILEIKVDDEFFYIIYEPLEIYNNINEMTTFLMELEQFNFQSTNFMRLPFFSGYSGYDIGYFLYNEPINIDINLNKKINFHLIPSDFNIFGLERFIKYITFIKNEPPVFKSNNNYTLYKDYFIQKISEKDGKINLFLPYQFIKMMGGDFIEDIL